MIERQVTGNDLNNLSLQISLNWLCAHPGFAPEVAVREYL